MSADLQPPASSLQPVLWRVGCDYDDDAGHRHFVDRAFLAKSVEHAEAQMVTWLLGGLEILSEDQIVKITARTP